MIKIGILSDTHGIAPRIAFALAKLGEVDAYIHLGDMTFDAEYIADKTGKKVYAVRGNNDPASERFPLELVIELDGARLLLVHGHRHEIDMYSTYAARARAIELNCDALLYGHTHVPQYASRDGITVLNPGSPALPRGGYKPSCALMQIDGGHIRANIITF